MNLKCLKNLQASVREGSEQGQRGREELGPWLILNSSDMLSSTLWLLHKWKDSRKLLLSRQEMKVTGTRVTAAEQRHGHLGYVWNWLMGDRKQEQRMASWFGGLRKEMNY
jgi:hypothetical protein